MNQSRLGHPVARMESLASDLKNARQSWDMAVACQRWHAARAVINNFEDSVSTGRLPVVVDDQVGFCYVYDPLTAAARVGCGSGRAFGSAGAGPRSARPRGCRPYCGWPRPGRAPGPAAH